MTLIYDETGVPGAHDELIQALRAEGKRPSLRTVRHYSGPEEGAERVHTDNERIAADYQARGVDVRPLSASEVEPETDTRAIGGGWHEVWVDGSLADTVQGQEAAASRLAELTGAEPSDSDTNHDDTD